MDEKPQGNEPRASVLPIDDVMAKWARREAMEVEIRPINKASILGALEASGIATVVIRFDGSGDSGQIEEICAEDADGVSLQIPAVTLEVLELPWGTDEPVPTPMNLAQALEAEAYRLLASTHPGWENNDGAYGEFTFDVAAGVIRLDHSDRYVAIEQYDHEF